MTRSLSSLIRSLVILALAIPTEAFASPARVRIAILPSIVGSGPGTIAATIGAIEQALRLRPALEPLTSDELLAGAAHCGADLACIGERADAAGAQLALRIVVNHSVSPPLISLHLVDATSGTLVREAFDEAGPDVAASVTALVKHLFDDAGYREAATVPIDLSPTGELIEEPSSIAASPWLWVGIGAGVAVIAVVAILFAVDPIRPDDGCIVFSDRGCP